MSVEGSIRRVIVAGSVNMDLVVRAPRHPRPNETVLGDSFQIFPGGKGANQAVAAARLGAHATLVALLGKDAFGESLDAFLRSEAIDASFLGRVEVATGIGCIVVNAESQNTIVVVPGANALLGPERVQAVSVAAGDILVSQLEIPLPTVQAFLAHGRQRGATTLLNPSPAQTCPPALLRLADILVLNEMEAAFFAGISTLDPTDIGGVMDAATTLRVHADQWVVVTLGERGAVAVHGDSHHAIPARQVRAVDPTGAGDCFVGAVAARLAAGDEIVPALHYANAAASLCVQKPGAAPSLPHRAEVESVH
ncbi:MAG TPA: ribokinase [Candidatus Krumholzibacteria bacterium]|nr:ribokinase [Candidatus Krumholzibacteria bacterium]